MILDVSILTLEEKLALVGGKSMDHINNNDNNTGDHDDHRKTNNNVQDDGDNGRIAGDGCSTMAVSSCSSHGHTKDDDNDKGDLIDNKKSGCDHKDSNANTINDGDHNNVDNDDINNEIHNNIHTKQGEMAGTSSYISNNQSLSSVYEYTGSSFGLKFTANNHTMNNSTQHSMTPLSPATSVLSSWYLSNGAPNFVRTNAAKR